MAAKSTHLFDDKDVTLAHAGGLRYPARVVGLTTSRVIQDYLEGLNTPKSLAVWLLFHNGEHEQLLSLITSNIALDADVIAMTHSIDRFRRDYAAVKLLRKSDFLKVDIDREKVALQKGRLAEDRNRDTNAVFRNLGLQNRPAEFHAVLHRAARIVADIVGPCPSEAELVDQFGVVAWTPGRNTSNSYEMRAATFKYAAPSLDATSGCVGLAVKLANSSPLWSRSVLESQGVDTSGPASITAAAVHVVNSSLTMCVPKDARTDRLIRVEPSVNSVAQRIVGTLLRDRYRRKTGNDLQSQFANQYRAYVGSINGEFSTIDLSSASDTIARLLVLELLPMDWVCLLDKLRCHTTVWCKGEQPERLEMFSSMGNGFTFELESILFYALAAASSGDYDILAYGDDIVVRTEDYETVVTALTHAGFSVNDEKSFHQGLFRESCGEDYFNGIRVTAPRLDHEINTLGDVVEFHNAVYGTDFWLGMPVPRQRYRMLRRWRKAISVLPIQLQPPLGPYGLGDGHFAVTLDEACPSRHPCWEGWYYETVVPIYNKRLVSTGQGPARAFRDARTDCVVNSWAVLAAAVFERPEVVMGPFGPFAPFVRFKTVMPHGDPVTSITAGKAGRLKLKQSGQGWNPNFDVPERSVKQRSFCYEWPDVLYS